MICAPAALFPYGEKNSAAADAVRESGVNVKLSGRLKSRSPPSHSPARCGGRKMRRVRKQALAQSRIRLLIRRGVGRDGWHNTFVETVIGSIAEIGNQNHQERFGVTRVAGEAQHSSDDLWIRVEAVVKPVHFLDCVAPGEVCEAGHRMSQRVVLPTRRGWLLPESSAVRR